MTAVRHTNGDYITLATLPTMTGDFTIRWWQKCNSGEYGGAGEHIVVGLGTTGGSSEGLLTDIGITANTTVTAVAFRNGGSDLQSTNIATGSFTGWICCMWRHTAGSASYTFSYRLENATTWTNVTLTLGAQLTMAGGALYIGSDQFAEHAVDSDTRAFAVKNSRDSDATALSESQALNTTPGGSPLHWLDLDSATNAGVNGGSAANGTVTGTLQTDTTEPVESVPLAANLTAGAGVAGAFALQAACVGSASVLGFFGLRATCLGSASIAATLGQPPNLAASLSCSAGITPEVYTSSFSATENPLSDGGRWSTPKDRTAMRASGGIAYGTQAGGALDDSIALCSGIWPPDCEIITTISKGSLSGIVETEHIHRGSDAGTYYEVNFAHDGQYCDFVRAEGGITNSDYTFLIPSLTYSIPGGVVNAGDRLRTRMVGDTITAWIDRGSGWVLIGSASDTSVGGHAKWSTGKPGIGAFITSGSGPLSNYAVTDLSINALTKADLIGVWLTANLSGGAACTGTLTLRAGLTCSAVLAGSIAGQVQLQAALAASATCTGTATGKGALAASLTGSATLAPALVGAGAISATCTGGATLTAAPGGLGALAASPVGSASITGGVGGTGALAASVSGGAACAGTLAGKGALSAGLSGGAACTGTLALQAGLACSAVVAGSMIAGQIQAALSAGATCAGAMAALGALAAGLTGGASVAVTLQAAGALAANLAGGASVAGNLGASGGNLAAAISAGAVLSAALNGKGSLAAGLGAGAAVSGTLLGGAACTASPGGSASCSGTILSSSVLTATAGGSASLAASLAGKAQLTAAPGASAVIGGMLQPYMFASLSGGAACAGTLQQPSQAYTVAFDSIVLGDSLARSALL